MKISSAMYDRMLPSAVAIVAALGVVMLGMGQRDLRLSAVALLAIGASFVLTDLTDWLRLNRIVANLAALAAVAISVNDFMRFERDTQLLAVANLLIYLQIVLLFQEKLPRVYWQILVLSLLQVVISAALNLGAMFGVLLVLYMLMMLVALMLLFARRESLFRSANYVGISPERGPSGAAASQIGNKRLARDAIALIEAPRTAAVRLRPGGILREVASASLATLLVTAVVFFSVPRLGNTTWQPTSLSYQPTVGFSGTVSLGTLGAVADNPELVMRVEFRRDNNPAQPYVVHNEPLFRGSILTHYARGEWRYPFRGQTEVLDRLKRLPPSADGVIQEIMIEPLDEPVIFGIYPIYRAHASGTSNHVGYDPLRQQYQRVEEVRNSHFRFDTLTTGFQDGLQRSITPERRFGNDSSERSQLLQTPSSSGAPKPASDALSTRLTGNDARQVDELPELTTTAQQQIERAGLSRDDKFFTFNAARTLELYLRSSRFRYSLQPQPRDPAIDPVEDFIKNNPQGHCEYFASALALMLRSQGIPSRVVVGFKGGDFNQVGGFYQVRQLHAHAWVEAYLDPEEIPPDMRPPDSEGSAGWLTLDPTPAADEGWGFDRGGFLNALADLGDYMKHLWSNYVVGLNAERQRDAIYRPLAQIATNVEQLVEGGQGVPAAIWQWLRTSALTFRGVLILVAVTALAVFVGRRLGWLVAAVYRRYKLRPNAIKRRERIEFYERLEEILARYGLVRGRQQTPLEFALAAGAQMVAESATRPHATLPRRIVEAYYRVRFGRHLLDAHEAEVVGQQLARLTEVLQTQKRDPLVPKLRLGTQGPEAPLRERRTR
jgi:transglutaminase-like putative cysteine protease